MCLVLAKLLTELMESSKISKQVTHTLCSRLHVDVFDWFLNQMSHKQKKEGRKLRPDGWRRRMQCNQQSFIFKECTIL